MRRLARAATAGSWVTSTRVVPRGAAGRRGSPGSSAGGAVQVAGRLVGEQDGRPGGEGAGQGDPLLLAAGELAGIVVPAVAQTHGGEQLVRPAGRRRAGRPARSAAARSPCAVRLPRSWKLLEDEADLVRGAGGPDWSPIDLWIGRPSISDLARGRAVQAGHQGQEGGLAAAGGAHDAPANSPGMEPQVDAGPEWSARARPRQSAGQASRSSMRGRLSGSLGSSGQGSGEVRNKTPGQPFSSRGPGRAYE